jgi:hypothetical protein
MLPSAVHIKSMANWRFCNHAQLAFGLNGVHPSRSPGLISFPPRPRLLRLSPSRRVSTAAVTDALISLCCFPHSSSYSPVFRMATLSAVPRTVVRFFFLCCRLTGVAAFFNSHLSSRSRTLGSLAQERTTEVIDFCARHIFLPRTPAPFRHPR